MVKHGDNCFNMNPRRRKILVLVVVASIALLAWLASRSREPEYEGKKLTEWLEQYGRPDAGSTLDSEAGDAIREIGTKAIPLLLKFISVKDSPLKTQFVLWCDKLEVFKIKIPAATEYHGMAVGGFHALGKKGRSAIPALMGLMSDTNSALTAVGCLWGIGSEATEALIAGTMHTNTEIRGRCAWMLGDVATNSPAALATLVKLLHDSQTDVRCQTTLALGRFHDKHAQIVPLLIDVLSESDTRQADYAAFSLARYGTNAGAALPELERVTFERNRLTKPSLGPLVRAVEAIVPESAFPFAMKLLSDSNPRFRWSGIELAARVQIVKGGEAGTLFEVARTERDTNVLFGIRNAAHRLSARWRTNDVPERATFHNGFLVRGPQIEKRLALTFRGDLFSDGADVILDELESRQARASFFLTDKFPSDREPASLLDRLFGGRHYVGISSATLNDLAYFAYNSGNGMERTASPTATDLNSNSGRIAKDHINQGLEDFYIPPPDSYDGALLPPTGNGSMTIIAPTPTALAGIGKTRKGEFNFVSSQTIFERILKVEREDPHGLNGFILTFPLDSGTGRTDKFYTRFGELLNALSARGYSFVRVDELFEPKP